MHLLWPVLWSRDIATVSVQLARLILALVTIHQTKGSLATNAANKTIKLSRMLGGFFVLFCFFMKAGHLCQTVSQERAHTDMQNTWFKLAHILDTAQKGLSIIVFLSIRRGSVLDDDPTALCQFFSDGCSVHTLLSHSMLTTVLALSPCSAVAFSPPPISVPGSVTERTSPPDRCAKHWRSARPVQTAPGAWP